MSLKKVSPIFYCQARNFTTDPFSCLTLPPVVCIDIVFAPSVADSVPVFEVVTDAAALPRPAKDNGADAPSAIT